MAFLKQSVNPTDPSANQLLIPFNDILSYINVIFHYSITGEIQKHSIDQDFSFLC